MTYSGERLIFDSDSHLMELPDFLSAHASQKIKNRLPDFRELLTGQFDPESHAGKSGHSPENVKKMMALGNNLTKGPKWHEALGSFNGTERGLAIDLLGFRRQVIFSSFCARLIFGAEDDELAYGAAAAHNRAMQDFARQDERMIGVAMVPLQDPEKAFVEINHAIELGLGAIWIAAEAPGGRSPGHPLHERLWSTMAEAGLPFILHVGSATLKIGDEWMNDGMPAHLSARGGAEVIGVEFAASAVERARANACANGLDEVEFIAGDLYREADFIATLGRVDALVLDPPRSGAGPLLRRWLELLHPTLTQIVYISCNPESFAEDAHTMEQAGYRLLEVGAYDMFPQTAHVETIGYFCRS